MIDSLQGSGFGDGWAEAEAAPFANARLSGTIKPRRRNEKISWAG